MKIGRTSKVAVAAAALAATALGAVGLHGASAATQERGARETGNINYTYRRGDITRSSEGVKVQALNALGWQDGVFHPLTPCRIVDTSSPTSVLGAMRAGEARNFVAYFSDFVDQGGSAGECGVMPTATAIQINVVAKAPTAAGNLRAYPYLDAKPNAALVNFRAGTTIANAATIGICREAPSAAGTGLCEYDFTVASSTVTHLVIDVIGYYEGPRMARINADGTVYAVSPSVIAAGTFLEGVPGEYVVEFDRDISECVYIATLDPHDSSSETGEVTVARFRLDDPYRVYVATFDSDGVLAEHAFSLMVHC